MRQGVGGVKTRYIEVRAATKALLAANTTSTHRKNTMPLMVPAPLKSLVSSL